MLKNSYQYYPQQTFLDYTENVYFADEREYSEESSSNSEYSVNDSVEYEYETRKFHSVENIFKYSSSNGFQQKKKNHSVNDLTQLQFLKGFKQNSERVGVTSLSEHQHLDTMILNGGSNSSFKSKRKASESDFKVKYKTEVCRYWEAKGYCPFGTQCAFAHGKQEKRSKAQMINNYRTKKCNQFHEHKYCPYGSRCQFLHSIRGSAENENMMQHFQADCFQRQLENPELLVLRDSECICLRSFLRPRLPVFEELTSRDNDWI